MSLPGIPATTSHCLKHSILGCELCAGYSSPVFGEVSCGFSGSTVSIDGKKPRQCRCGCYPFGQCVNTINQPRNAFTGKFADGDQYSLRVDEAGNTRPDERFSSRRVYIVDGASWIQRLKPLSHGRRGYISRIFRSYQSWWTA